MKERLEAIIKHENLTPSRLADLIGVQRSGVSHILSGRNKPGLDFLNKLLIQFPHINGDWLITGEGTMLKGGSAAPQQQQLSLSSQVKSEPAVKPPSTRVDDEPAPVYKKLAEKALKQPVLTGKDIESIVVFYSDGSFKAYRPE